MTDKLHATIQVENGATAIKFSGVLDEDNRLGDLVERIVGERVLINLGDVERINSCGTRDWVNWLALVEGRGKQPVLVECSPAIVAQLNLVRNFCGTGVVKSFFVPYHCASCDEEKMLLVEVADLGAPPHEPSTCRCDDCESVMDFDDMADSYFAFVSNHHRASAKELDNDVARGSSASIRSRSRISQPILPKRASVPTLSAFQRPSTPSMEASTSPAQPRLAVRASSSTIAKPSATASPPSDGLAIKLLIGALLCTVAVLAYLLLAA